MSIKSPFFDEDFQSRFVSAVNEVMREQISEFQDQMQKFFQASQKSMIDAIKPFIDSMERLSEETEAASKVIGYHVKTAGFWIPPSSSLTFIRDLRDLCISGGTSKKMIRQFYLNSYKEKDYELLTYSIQSWKDNDKFTSRMKIIESALNAHTRGEYELSIPALLPVIEGILSGIAGRTKRQGESMSDFAEKIISNEYTEGMKEASKEAVVSFVTGSTLYGKIPHKYFHSDKFPKWLEDQGFEETQVLNRHAILHGVQLNYSSPENSLRAFLLLDALSMIETLRFIDDYLLR